MEYQYFQEFLESKGLLHFIMYLFFVCVYIFIYRKHIINIFDPMVLYLIPSLASATFVVTILFFNGFIGEWIFLKLITYQLLFVLGSKLLNYRKKIFILKKDSQLFGIFYFLHTGIFFIIFIIFIKKFGVSLIFNKFLIYQSGALLNYGTMCIVPGQLILIIIKREFFLKKSKLDFLFLFSLFLVFLVKGGKGEFINFISCIIITVLLINKFNQSKVVVEKIRKIQGVLVAVSSVVVLFYFSLVTQAKSISDIIYQVYLRLINYGDIYYTGLVNNVMDRIPESSFYHYYLWAFVSPFRRIFSIKNPVIVGNEVLKELYNMDFSMGGPNFRFDVALNYYFPFFFGIIIAVFLGLMFSWLRNLIIFKNFLDVYLQALFIFSSILISIDFGLFLANLMAILVYIPTLIMLSLFFKQILYKNMKI